MAVAALRRARRSRAPVPYEVTQAAITGMRDSYDSTTADPRKAFLIQNAYPFLSEIGGGMVGRPGFRLFGTQLGAPGARNGQLITQLTKLNGTEHTIAFVGGLMYELDWGARTITNIPLGGGVVVNAAAKLYAVTFADRLVVTDGVNLPWTWNGAAFQVLVNAPVIYGKPVVYYAKLFCINAANRIQLQWSEENDPTTGYATAIYDNTWILGQADQNQLTALAASNDALYVFRERSIGKIEGAVTRQFRADGTRAGVSNSVGSKSPDGIAFHNDELWFVDADGQPHMIRPGAEPVPVWEDFRETIRLLPRVHLDEAVALDYTPAGLFLFALAQVGSTIPNLFLVYNPATPEAVAVWRGFGAMTAAMVKDDTLRPVMVHLSDDGFVYDHGRPEDSLFDDFTGTVGGAIAIEHRVIGTPQGMDLDREVDWSELTIIGRADSPMHLNVRYETPRGVSAYQQVVAAVGGYSVYGSAIYGVSVYSLPVPEIRRKIGIKRLGRWIKPEVQHQTVGERFGFLAWRALGYAMPGEINVP